MENKFSNLDVGHEWKKVFEAVDEKCVDGKWWKNKPKFNQLPKKDRKKIYNDILNVKIFIISAILGPFYYLFKGMWMKAIVYTIIFMYVCDFLSRYSSLSEPYYLLSVIWGGLVPYDYYRYKILQKQW